MTIEQEPMSNKDAKIEECKFFKKVYLGKHCELFKSPCYGTACNFHKEFIKLTQLESVQSKSTLSPTRGTTWNNLGISGKA